MGWLSDRGLGLRVQGGVAELSVGSHDDRWLGCLGAPVPPPSAPDLAASPADQVVPAGTHRLGFLPGPALHLYPLCLPVPLGRWHPSCMRAWQ